MPKQLLSLSILAVSMMFLPSADSFARDLKLDISGKEGLPPKDGDCCDNMPRTRSRYETPRQGDDARPGTAGTDSLNAEIHLRESTTTQGQVVIYGPIYNDRRVIVQNLDETMSLQSSLFVDASGGRGVRGGIGGDGQSGCHGEDGRNATEYSNAERGEDGCDGASNGMGTPGTDGGDGGKVRFYIPQAQTHLSLLVNANVAGGDGGPGGRDGRVGQRGSGGDGGASKTYIDHYKTERQCHWVPDPPSSSGGGGYGGGGYGGGGGGGLRDLGNGYSSFESYLIPLDELPPIPLKEKQNPAVQVAGVAEEIFLALLGVQAANAGQECENVRVPVYETRPAARDGDSGNDGRPRRGNLSAGHTGDRGSVEFVVVDESGRESIYKRPFDLTLESYTIADLPPGGNNDGVFEPGEELTISNIIVRNVGMPSPAAADVILSVGSGQWILTDPLDGAKIPALNNGERVQLNQVFKAKVKSAFPKGNGESWGVSDTIVSTGSIPKIRRTLDGLRLPKTIFISYPVEISPIQSVTSIGPGETASFQWRLTNRSNSDFKGLNGATRKIEMKLEQKNQFNNAIASFNFENNEDSSSKQFVQTVTQLKARESIIISGEVQFLESAEPYTYVDFESSLGLEVLGGNSMIDTLSHHHRINILQTYRHSPDSSLLLITHKGVEREEYKNWLELFESLGLKADVWDIDYNKGLNLTKDLKENGKSLLANYRGKTIVMINSPLSNNSRNTALNLLDKSQFFQAAMDAGIQFYVVGGSAEQLQQELTALHFSPNQQQFSTLSSTEFLGKATKQPLSDILEGAQSLKGYPSDIEKLQQTIRDNPGAGYSLTLTMDRQGRLIPSLVPTLSIKDGGMVASATSVSNLKSRQFILGSENVRQLMLSLSLSQKLLVFDNLSKDENQNGENLSHVTSVMIHDIIENLYLNQFQKGESNKLAQEIEETKAFLSKANKQKLTSQAQKELGRLLAAIQVFAELSSNSKVDAIAKNLIPSVDKGSDTEQSLKSYVEQYKEFSAKRKKALPGNFDQRFDAYKMFTLPVRGHSQFVDTLNVFRPIYLGSSR